MPKEPGKVAQHLQCQDGGGGDGGGENGDDQEEEKDDDHKDEASGNDDGHDLKSPDVIHQVCPPSY